MKELDSIAEALFDKLRSRFERISLGDENARATDNPTQARFYNFDYSIDGNNFGNVTVSIIDDQSLKIYFSKDLSNKLTKEEQDDWFTFLKEMRRFARRNMLTFDTRDINRSSLNLRDIKQQTNNGNWKSSELDIQESRMYGTRKKSYDHVGETRLIIRHRTAVDEDKRGARSRNIDVIFVENNLGERFRLPFTNLRGARAVGQHIAHGGMISDDRTQEIYALVEEMKHLSKFLRATRNVEAFESEEVPGLVECARERYYECRKGLDRMSTPKGYQAFWEDYMAPESIEMEDQDTLKDSFTKRFLDQRIEEALPFVYKAYVRKEGLNEFAGLIGKTVGKMFGKSKPSGKGGVIAPTTSNRNMLSVSAQAFSNFGSDMNTLSQTNYNESEITEGTWALPESDEDVEKFKRIFAKPIQFGPEGNDATSAMYDIFGDDELFDNLYELAEVKGPEADARPTIVKWFTKVHKDIVTGNASVSRDIEESMAKIFEYLKTWKPEAEEPADAEAPAEEPAESVNVSSMGNDIAKYAQAEIKKSAENIAKAMPKAKSVQLSSKDYSEKELTGLRKLAGLSK